MFDLIAAAQSQGEKSYIVSIGAKGVIKGISLSGEVLFTSGNPNVSNVKWSMLDSERNIFIGGVYKLARIASDGSTIYTWTPPSAKYVRAMRVIGNYVYVQVDNEVHQLNTSNLTLHALTPTFGRNYGVFTDSHFYKTGYSNTLCRCSLLSNENVAFNVGLVGQTRADGRVVCYNDNVFGTGDNGLAFFASGTIGKQIAGISDLSLYSRITYWQYSNEVVFGSITGESRHCVDASNGNYTRTITPSLSKCFLYTSCQDDDGNIYCMRHDGVYGIAKLNSSLTLKQWEIPVSEYQNAILFVRV